MTISSIERVVKFWDLRAELSERNPHLNGKVPIDAHDIVRKSVFYGRKVSKESVHRFLRGESKVDGPTFPVIQNTIEGLADIKIDFAGSPYEGVSNEGI